MTDVGRQAPPMTPAMLAAVLATAVVWVTSSVVGTRFGFTVSYQVAATSLAGVVLAMALVGVRAHHPFPVYGLANLVTAARAMLVAIVAATTSQAPAPDAAWMVVVVSSVAALLDLADGWLARRSGLMSVFGARFDMEVDALLVLTLSVLAWRFDKAGPWIVSPGLLRYLFVLAARPWPWMAAGLPPSRRRQTVCVVQIVSLIVAIAPLVPSPLSGWVAGVGLAALVWSFWVDIRWLQAGQATRRSGM